MKEIKRILVCGHRSRIPQALSNIAFRYNGEGGYKGAELEVRQTIEDAYYNNQDIARALNQSGLTWINWRTIEKNSNRIVLQAEDFCENLTDLIIVL